MNKKILAIGSITACMIMLLASLSPVVGYNSARSSVRDSPLFAVRTKRAIDEESETLKFNYLRKGQLMSFPARDSKNALIQKAIDRISQMDDKTFNKFIELVAYYYQQEQTEGKASFETIIAGLKQIRANPEIMKRLPLNLEKEDFNFTIGKVEVLACWLTFENFWLPGCVILATLYFFIGSIFVLILLFIIKPPSFTCN